MPSMKIIHVLLLAALLAASLSACGGSQETVLSGEEREAVLAYSEEMTDHLMAGMNAADYAAFSQDFSPEMRSAMPEDAFAKFSAQYGSSLGAYISRQVSQVAQSGEYVAVVYDAVFEKDDSVTMRVVFQAEEPHQISGLWFK